jgi:hypothetical protein
LADGTQRLKLPGLTAGVTFPSAHDLILGSIRSGAGRLAQAPIQLSASATLRGRGRGFDPLPLAIWSALE